MQTFKEKCGLTGITYRDKLLSTKPDSWSSIFIYSTVENFSDLMNWKG